ncbi:hypothetical protein ACOME3_007969 [Neoechinorhynchus agilis]
MDSKPPRPSKGTSRIHYYENERHFQKALDSNHIVVVKFFTHWCGRCYGDKNTLNNFLNRSLSAGILFAKVDLDEAVGLLSKYEIKVFPTYIIFVNGQEHSRYMLEEIDKLDECIKVLTFKPQTIDDGIEH